MWLVILIIIVSLVYLASMQGITCCNSGSLYALLKSIVTKEKLSINEFIKYTKYKDYSKVGKNYFTDRPPGLSFAAIPFYILNLNVTLVSVISGVLSSILVYLISMQLVNNPIIAFFTSIIFAFCTTNWRYSTLFLIHSLSTFLVLLAVYFLLIEFSPIVIGLLIGLSTIVEYTNAVFFFGVSFSQIVFGNFYPLLTLSIGYFIGVLPLLVYNKKCFGSPFTTSYRYSAYFKWSNSPKTTFVTPIFKGILGLLFFIPKKRGFRLPGGILSMSPVLIFGILGFLFLPFSYLVLFLFLSLPLFLIISKHKTWWGGGAGDYRYLSSMIPYLVIPISLSMKNLSFLWPLILFLSLISLIMIVSRMVIYTILPSDLKKIDPEILTKIKKRKIAVFELFKLKYLKKIIPLTFKCIFIRKIHFEKKDLSKKTR